MTDDSSLLGRTLPTPTGRTDTHRINARNRIGDQGGFDFRLTSEGRASTGTATVLGLFAGYLGATAHAVTGPLDEAPRVERVTVDGAVDADGPAEPTSRSDLVSIHATIHADTDADSESIERWRRLLRDHEATRTILPTGASLSVSVVRTVERTA